MADIIQWRRDTQANWNSVNPVLASGEAGWEIDTSRLKHGDGLTNWSNLPYTLSSPYTYEGFDTQIALTQAEYDLLVPDPDTIYFVTA